MGLDSKLQNEGSIYAYNATNLLPTTGFGAPGENTPQSILATINSPLHAYESQQDPFVSRDLGVGDTAFNTTIQNEYNKYLTRLPGTCLKSEVGFPSNKPTLISQGDESGIEISNEEKNPICSCK